MVTAILNSKYFVKLREIFQSFAGDICSKGPIDCSSRCRKEKSLMINPTTHHDILIVTFPWGRFGS